MNAVLIFTQPCLAQEDAQRESRITPGEVLAAGLPGYEFRLLGRQSGDGNPQLQWSTPVWQKLLPTGLLQATMTLDVEAYLGKRIPPGIHQVCLQNRTTVTIMGGIWQDAARALPTMGIRPIYVFTSIEEINNKAYIFGRDHEGRRALVVTNIFGADRPWHLFLEYAHFLARHRPLGLLNLFYRPLVAPEAFSSELCQASLANLEARPGDTVVLGYQSSFNIVAWYVQAYLSALAARNNESSHRPGSESTEPKKATIETAVFLAFKDHLARPASFPRPARMGNAYFPYWCYEFTRINGTVARFITFRNLYGDAAGTLVAELGGKGFRRFVCFGNSGGIGKDCRRGDILAPVRVTTETESLDIPNAAAERFPAKAVRAVKSVLEESAAWLKSLPTAGEADLVEIEHLSIARALRHLPDAWFYSGLVVSDRPGERDLTQHEESDRTMLRAKDRFLFEIIRDGMLH